MRISVVRVAVLAAAISLMPLVALFVHEALAQSSGCTTVATVKCLYEDKPGDCGSCTCNGVGRNGKCDWSGHFRAGCYCNGDFTACHECNIPWGGGGGGGGPGDPGQE